MTMLSAIRATQDGFRLGAEEMSLMMEFVAKGGIYSREGLVGHNPKRTSLIALSRFEDGQLYVRDGFHRLASIILGGRKYLFEMEYFIEDMTYARYINLNLGVNWFTPFDPRIEVRIADFFSFKDRVLTMRNAGDDPTSFILRNKHLYAVPRTERHDPMCRLIQAHYPDLAKDCRHACSV